MKPISGYWLAASLCALTLVSVPRHQDVLLYNHSPSIPVGVYVRVDTPRILPNGAIVTIRAIDAAPQTAKVRSFDQPRNRFIKRVAARAGDRVCADQSSLTINDGSPIFRQPQTPADPMWVECRALLNDELLLLGDHANSFDGRYWGPVSSRVIEGVWRKIL